MPSQRTSGQRDSTSGEGNIPSDTQSPRAQNDEHVLEIQRRQFGYAFGGPEESWCAPGANSPRVELPIIRDDQSNSGKTDRFTGCLKYRTCHLVPEEIKWRRWEDLQESEREQLRSIGCYRASRPRSDWDSLALVSRRARPDDARWIGNPFGIRTPLLKEIIDEIRSRNGDVREHRDLWPCPLGGCVTPEMQRDHLAGSSQVDPRETANTWANTTACPFYYRHTDANLTVAIKNSQRFTQCYLTLPGLLKDMKRFGLVVGAPIIRAIVPTGSGESYWYSFYSGFSFLQLPPRYPQSEARDPLLPFRWIVTTLARLQTERVYRSLPIGKVFEGAESGFFLTAWERSQRIVSISDGQATSFLLQWVLLQRLKTLISEHRPGSDSLDLTQTVSWTYEQSDGVVARLENLGFSSELKRLHLTVTESGGSLRSATLLEDFLTLGLLENGPTGFLGSERVRHCVAWLRARFANFAAEHPPDSLEALIRDWLKPMCPALEDITRSTADQLAALDLLADISVCLMRSAGIDLKSKHGKSPRGWAGLREITVANLRELPDRITTFEQDVFDKVCRLVPSVHFLVRAETTVPLRWLFVPSAAGAEKVHTPATVRSGLIVLVEDELTSSPYVGGRVNQHDSVLERLYGFLPILLLAASIEEEHVRSEYILAQGQWAIQRNQFEWLQHLIKTIRNSITSSEGCDADYVEALLVTLQQSLSVLPEQRQLSQPNPIAVPVLEAATTALDVFHSFYGKRKRSHATFINECPSRVSALITPLSQTHRHETTASQLQRASRDLTLLLLDLFCQRADANEKEFTFQLSQDLSNGTVHFSIQLEKSVDDSWIWDSRQPLDHWDIGRGFYLTFSASQAMGSTAQSIKNVGDHGIIRIEFRGEQ